MESLPEAEAHVWIVNPDGIQPALRDRYLAILGPEERERHRRLRRERSRREFLVAHALARVILSRYAPVAPEAWSFSSGEHGRPEIGGPPGAPPLRFNLSHTRGLVACAVIQELDIGVDVENTSRRGRYLDLATRFFSAAEAEALRDLAPEERAERFLELWTLREAYLKARGRGISLPLRGFHFRLSDSDPPRIGFDPALVRDDPDGWQLCLHRPDRTHVLALAIRRAARRDRAIRIFEGIPGPCAAGVPPRCG